MTELLDRPGVIIAVVGATDTPGKYGGRIYRDLKSKGFTVYPVHPSAPTVDGDPAYRSVADLPEPPDIVDLVVPHEIGARVVGRLDDPLPFVWVQPGAEGDALAEMLAERGAPHVADGSCIMVATAGMEQRIYD